MHDEKGVFLPLKGLAARLFASSRLKQATVFGLTCKPKPQVEAGTKHQLVSFLSMLTLKLLDQSAWKPLKLHGPAGKFSRVL